MTRREAPGRGHIRAKRWEQTTSPCTAAAAEIATPLKHRTRPRGKSRSGSASREAAATGSKASRKSGTYRNRSCEVVSADWAAYSDNNNSTAGHVGPGWRSRLKHVAQRCVSVRSSSPGWVSWKHAAAAFRAQQAKPPAPTPTWLASNKEYSRGARAQGRRSNRKSERHLRVHRASLRPRLPRPVPRTSARLRKPDKTKRPCGIYVILNCRPYIWIKLQLGKL